MRNTFRIKVEGIEESKDGYCKALIWMVVYVSLVVSEDG
jgi:hypothetical protein